ncbi:MAG: transposase [Desulfomonile sp.]|nr:transposase [Desulfomonile sp.]
MTVKEDLAVAGKRRRFSAEDKVRILRRHLVDKVPVSDLCDEQGLHPTLFYKWQKEFFENGASAFGSGTDMKLQRPTLCRPCAKSGIRDDSHRRVRCTEVDFCR